MEWEKPVLVDLNMATFEAKCNPGGSINIFGEGQGRCDALGSSALEKSGCLVGSSVGAEG